MDRIILASSSPRRREILEKYNMDHRVVKSKTLEKINPKDRPEVTAMGLAFEKAMDVAQTNPDSLVIGADTIVVYENQILGKPVDREEALRILSLLNGKVHEVISGLSLIHMNKKIKLIDYEKTKVKFRKLDEEYIERYIDSKEPFDKAGAYGIQDYGALLVENIEGSYLNVVGLPLVKLDILLMKYFDISIMR